MARVLSIGTNHEASSPLQKSLLWVSLAYGIALFLGVVLSSLQLSWLHSMESRLAAHQDWVFLAAISVHSLSVFLLHASSNLGVGVGQLLAGYFVPAGIVLGLFRGFACGLLLPRISEWHFFTPVSLRIFYIAVVLQSVSTVLFLSAGMVLGIGVWRRYRSGQTTWFRVSPALRKSTVKVCAIACLGNLLSTAAALLLQF